MLDTCSYPCRVRSIFCTIHHTRINHQVEPKVHNTYSTQNINHPCSRNRSSISCQEAVHGFHRHGRETQISRRLSNLKPAIETLINTQIRSLKAIPRSFKQGFIEDSRHAFGYGIDLGTFCTFDQRTGNLSSANQMNHTCIHTYKGYIYVLRHKNNRGLI